MVQLRAEGLSWREVEGEIVALDAHQSEYFAINATGRLLWPQLAHGATRGEFVDTLAASFEVDEATGAADLDAFLADLAERGLLRCAAAGSTRRRGAVPGGRAFTGCARRSSAPAGAAATSSSGCARPARALRRTPASTATRPARATTSSPAPADQS